MINFNLLNLEELELGLDDLLNSSERQAALIRIAVWNTYRQPLIETFQKILVLPEVIRNRPLADRLKEVRIHHGRYGRTLFFTCQAYIQDPKSRPETVAKAETILAAFIPALRELSRGYAAKANAALRRRPALEVHAAALRSFALPDNRSLYDVACDYLAAGESLDVLLTARSQSTGRRLAANPRQALVLRFTAVSQLTALRDRVIEQIKLCADQPQDLPNRIFSKFAELEQLHRKRLDSSNPQKQRQPTAGRRPRGNS